MEKRLRNEKFMKYNLQNKKEMGLMDRKGIYGIYDYVLN